MSEISRRDFLKLGGKFAALMGLAGSAVPQLAYALEKMADGRLPVLWLQGLSCSGCSVSFLNADSPGPAQVLTDYVSMLFHSNLSSATGETAMYVIEKSIKKGGYILAVEGSVPARMPQACRIGHYYFNDLLEKAAVQAQAIVSVGTCSTFGGIPAAENNPTGATSVPEYLNAAGISKPHISLPGCPCHPDWLVGTLAHVASFGLPALDSEHRPKMFYSKIIHDQCPRFPDYERENYASSFGEDGCLFKLGCLGVHTYADCTIRSWNSGVNNCIKAGAPCIGCASKEFARRANFPFITKTGTA